jgi:PAS domain S-box-containing protein
MAKVNPPINPAVAPGDLNLMQQTIDGDFRFRKLIENSSSGISLLDKGFNIIYRSPSAERINGWNDREREKKAVLDLIHPADREPLKLLLEEVAGTPGLSKTISFRSKHFNGHFIWLESIYTNMLNEPGIEAIVCNFIDVTEKKQAEESLQQTINELFAYKHALDESAIVAITDQKGIIKHVNNNFCRISKYSAEELIGKDHRIINSSYHDKAFIRNLWTTIASGKIWKGELKNKAKDGSFYWVDTTIVPFLNENGKPYQYVAIRSDITERKLNQEKIIESEQFTKTITDNLPALIAYWDADLRCLFANKPYLDWFDKQPHEMRGISKRELLGKEEFKLHEDHIQNVLKGQPQRFERTFHKSNGQQIFTDTQYLPDREGDIIKGFYSLIYDVTAVKIAEEEVSRKSEQIEDLLENITDGFIALDENLCYTYANKKIGEMLGVAPESLIGKNIWKLFPDAVGSATYEAIQTAFEERKYVCSEDFYAPLNLWQENRVYPSGNGITMFIRDISEKKNEELRKTILSEISVIFAEQSGLNEALFKVAEYLVCFGNFSLAELWLIGHYKKKINQKAQFSSKPEINEFFNETNEIKSFEKGEGLPGVVWETGENQFWRHIDENESFVRKAAAKKAGLKTAFGLPLYYNKEIIGVLILGLSKDEKSEKGFSVLSENFSTHLGAEIRRKQLEEENNQILSLAPDIICTAGIDGYFKKINPAMSTLLEYSEEELLSTPFLEFVHVEDRNPTTTEIKNMVGGSDSWYFENRYITKSGKIKWLAWTATGASEEGLLFCVARDITENKELEQLLHKASTLARIGGWEIDIEKGVVNWSHMTREIHEAAPDFELNADNAMTFSPDGESREIIFKTMSTAMEYGTPGDVEVQIVTAKGNTKWVRIIVETEFADGKCRRIYGSMQDIDARKKAELAVKEVLEERNTILESIGDAFFAVDKNWIVTYWNNMAEKAIGMPKNKILGQNLWQVFSDVVGSERHREYQNAMESGEVSHYEEYSARLKAWIEVSIYPAANGLTVYIRDITDRKKAEAAATEVLEERNTILESIDDAFFAVDKNWVVTYWNSTAENIFGKSRSQIVNRSLLEEFPHMVDTAAYKYYCEVLDTGRSAHFEYYSSRYNLWLDTNVYPAANGFTVYMKNVTARKNAESSAMAALEERNIILESIDDAFFAVDKNWVVTYWNNTAEEVLMKTKNEMLNRNLWEVFSDSIDSESYKKYHEAAETNRAMHFEDHYAPLNKWYEISAYPSHTGLSVYFKDITERKTSETRLKELNASLKKHARELAISNAELEQFAYVASHDLQEPLRMVTSFMTQLEKKYSNVVDEKGKQYIHFAVDGAKRMRQIILDLLEFSRVGRTEDDLEEVNLNNLVNEILALYRKQIEEKKARIVFDNLPVIQTYKTPFRQVLQNLISNSLKYQAYRNIPLITISYTESNTHWQFSVKDNGIGIDAVYFDKVFIIFQRLHNKDEYSGTGMGLAITKKIVENLGGKIWIESEEGKGSTFYFTILKNPNI